MTIIHEKIDPDGDTLIIVSYLPVLSQNADESVATDEPAAEQSTTADEPVAVEQVLTVDEPTVEGPAAAYEPGHRISHSILSETYGTTHCHEENEPVSELRLKVSKKHLTVASRRARRMFQGAYLEAQKSEVDGFYHWKIEPLFDPEALKIVLRIIHAQTQDLPRDVTLQLLVSIAKVVDDLCCHEAVSFFAKIWTSRVSQSIPNKICDELVQWMFIASVFGLREEFKRAARVAVMQSTGRINGLELPIFPAIIDDIEQRRQDLLQDLIDQLHAVLDNLCSGYSSCVSQCAIMMLGALTKQMHNMRLHSPRPARPFLNLSLYSALEAVRRFDSPSLYLPSEDTSRYSYDPFDSSFLESKEDVWVLQMDTFSSSRRKKKNREPFTAEDGEQPNTTPKRLTFHCCRLQTLLEPVIDLLEAKVFTLDLGCP